MTCKIFESTPGLLFQCAMDIPNEYANGDALNHILAHVESSGSPEPDRRDLAQNIPLPKHCFSVGRKEARETSRSAILRFVTEKPALKNRHNNILQEEGHKNDTSSSFYHYVVLTLGTDVQQRHRFVVECTKKMVHFV